MWHHNPYRFFSSGLLLAGLWVGGMYGSQVSAQDESSNTTANAPASAELYTLLTPSLEDGPWDSAWTMIIKDAERILVDYQDKSYLVIEPTDLGENFIVDQDVLMIVKFSRVEDGKAKFYNLDTLLFDTEADRWKRSNSGDNFFMLGSISQRRQGLTFTPTTIINQPNDAALVRKQLDLIPADDGAARIAFANQLGAITSGDSLFWNDTAQEIIFNTVQHQAAHAAKQQSISHLLQALRWARDELNSLTLMADLASSDWTWKQSLADRSLLVEFMNAAGYTPFHGETLRWLPQAEAIRQEFEQRLQKIHWRDAHGLYQLGRWVDERADLLSNARALSHRAYQLGHRADPNHNLIRLELGLDPVTGGTSISSQRQNNSYLDDEFGLYCQPSLNWRKHARAVSSQADVTWESPTNKTDFIGLRTQSANGIRTREQAWQHIQSVLQSFPQFQLIDQNNWTHPLGSGIRGRFTHVSSGESRSSQLRMILNTEQDVLILVWSSSSSGTSWEQALDLLVDDLEFANPEAQSPSSESNQQNDSGQGVDLFGE